MPPTPHMQLTPHCALVPLLATGALGNSPGLLQAAPVAFGRDATSLSPTEPDKPQSA
ncbi:hypothetical protein C7821_101418 [Streptomyces sp. VMFN-G11Ma]|nr:hypothetical protein C7821_101418 [Streptomyces sp. VMFN-G11Ma]